MTSWHAFNSKRLSHTPHAAKLSAVLILLGLILSAVFARSHSAQIKAFATDTPNTISVDTATVIRTIPPTFFGVNYVAFWDPAQGSLASQKALAQTPIRAIRFAGGSPANWYDWKNPYCSGRSSTSPLDLWNYTKGIGSNTRILFQTNYQGNGGECNTTGINVNDPSYQADWVAYNQQNGIPASMEVGNEADVDMHSWHDPVYQTYIDAFNAQARAMHLANPSIKVYGPAATNEWFWWDAQSNSPDALNMFLQQTGNKTGTGAVDGVSIHFYRPDTCAGADDCYTQTKNVAQYWLSPNGPWESIKRSVANNDTRQLPVSISEWNVGDSNSITGFNPTVGHALVTADMIGAFAQAGVDEEDYFDLHISGRQFGLLYNTNNGDSRQLDSPNPTYYAMVLWGKMGNYILTTTQTADPNTTVSSYSTKKDDGSVQIMSINKSNLSQPVTLSYQNADFTNGTMKIYRLTSTATHTSLDATYNMAVMPSPQQPLPGPELQPLGGNTFTYTIPAYSIVVFDATHEIFTPTPTATPTITPTNTPTPTATPTPKPTATPSPTPTKIPTPTPTRTPTPTPSDTIPPVITINYPSNKAVISKNNSITIKTTATDNKGVSKVVFLVNAVTICTDATTPYTCIWKPPSAGKYTISATAYDAAGNSKTATADITAN